MRYRAVAIGLVFDGRIVQTFSESLEIVRRWAKSTADQHKVPVDINLTEERCVGDCDAGGSRMKYLVQPAFTINGAGRATVEDGDLPLAVRAAIDLSPVSECRVVVVQDDEPRLSDYALVAHALAIKVARWEPFSHSKLRGELCFGGMRYGSELDDSGVPSLSPMLRQRLELKLAEVGE